MNYKNRKEKNTNLRRIPFYLRNSLTNLFNRAGTSEEDLSEIECSDSNPIECSTSNIAEHVEQKSNLSDISSESNNQNLEYPIFSNDKIEMTTNPPVDLSAKASAVFNSLKIPDAVKDLPKFDGNPRLLFDFIDNVEEILSLACSINGTSYGKILLRAIRNKIEGSANEVLNMYGTPLEWTAIKDNLILHYSDKRNETSLIKDLHNLKQSSKTVENFYSEVIELQATMSNHIHIHENDSNVIEAKKKLFSEMCLNVFLSGLKEPLGSTIRAMQPNSLPEAFACCVKEQNIFYSKSEQQTNNQKPKPTRFFQFPKLPAQPHRFFTYPRYSQPTYRPQYSFNQSNNRPFNQSFNHPLNRPFNHPFNTQQRQQSNPQFRPFAPNPSNKPNLPKPEPMDTSSGMSRFRQQTYPPSRPNNIQTNRTPNFISEELFNLDEQNLPVVENNSDIYTNDHYYTNLDRYYNNYSENSKSDTITTYEPPEVDEGNFSIDASTNPSDM